MNDSLSGDLAFDPVPSASNRRDGWTPERQHAFILALAQLGLIGAAARSVGMSRKSAYVLLKRAGPDSGFARAWGAAIAEGRAQARDLGIERAIHGTQIPYFYRGIQRGTRIVYNDRLLIAALRAVGWARGRASPVPPAAAPVPSRHSPQSAGDVPLPSSPSLRKKARPETDRARTRRAPR